MIDWRHWHNEPYLVGGLIFLGWLYAILTGPLRGRIAPGQPFLRGRACAFYAALIPAAILFLLGLPRWLVDPVLDRPGVRGLARFAGHPLICGLIYTLVISIWHVPALYDWALRDKFVHVLEHVMFFGAALFYWWPHLSPSKVAPPASYAVQMLYQLGIVIGMTPLFAYITFSHDILYPTYEFAPRIIDNFSPAQDQLLAGTMMKLGGLLVATTAIAVSFFRWYQTTELQTRRR